MVVLYFAILIICSYLLGNVSFARLISKKEKTEITKSGSGNPGSMNMLRTHGAFMAILTLIFDAIKGAIPSLIGLYCFKEFGDHISFVALYSAGLAVVIGHIYPVFYKFKGGKGIASSVGIFMVADPVTTSILFGFLFVIFYFTKIGSVVSILMVSTFIMVQAFRLDFSENWIALLVLLIIVLLDLFAHRQNFKRLFSENGENETDFQSALEKDMKKMHEKKIKKLNKADKKRQNFQEKMDKIETKLDKYQEKIDNKFEKIEVKIEEKYEKKANKIGKTIKNNENGEN